MSLLPRFLIKLILSVAFLSSHFAIAGDAVYTNDGGVALSGHDAVAYFTVRAPTKGVEKFSAKYDNATYWFASEENRAVFVADPAKYAPQYGGFCAFAASLGKKAPTDPTQWSVVDNKLYLNYDGRIQKQWKADVPGFIKQADAKWLDIKNN